MRAVDLNAADFEELLSIDGIDKERAKALIRYRNSHGALRGWEDLENVPGFDFESVGRLQEQAVVNPPASRLSGSARSDPGRIIR